MSSTTTLERHGISAASPSPVLPAILLVKTSKEDINHGRAAVLGTSLKPRLFPLFKMHVLGNRNLRWLCTLTMQKDKQVISRNIADEARRHDLLYIWTDCDREGENIGAEIRDIARKANPRIHVKRARFSNIERALVLPLLKNIGAPH